MPAVPAGVVPGRPGQPSIAGALGRALAKSPTAARPRRSLRITEAFEVTTAGPGGRCGASRDL